MPERPPAARLPEADRNAPLRRVDWRYLVPGEEAPRAADLARGRLSRATRLAFPPAVPGTGAELAVVSRPTSRRLARARAALVPGGALYCERLLPWPGGAARLQRRLIAAGFDDVRLLWPGPSPWGTPQFWLPVPTPEAGGEVIAARRGNGWRYVLLHRAWPVLVGAGAVAPLGAIARRAGPAPPTPDALARALGADVAGVDWVLLTGGTRAVNKVVGLPGAAAAAPGDAAGVVVKFARVEEADAGLLREAQVLRALAERRPDTSGVPRVRALVRRGGRVAVAETAIRGTPLLGLLTPATLPDLVDTVGAWLAELAGADGPRGPEAWWPRLVETPLRHAEEGFGGSAAAGSFERARQRLGQLPALPIVCEHRDCSPWNIVLQDDGAPGFLDWESAELDGLPALDLVYFVANCAFVLAGALESGRTREVYRGLLDPSTPNGALFARCLGEYAARVGVDPAALPALRLLCWIVHARSDLRRLTEDAAGSPSPAARRTSVFLGLIEEELLAGDAART